MICQFRVSDHSLGIERGRYYKIHGHLRLCEKYGVVDNEAHFFLYCTNNDRIRTAFLDDLLYPTRINTLNDIDKIENTLNPTSSQQVKSLGSFIERLWGWGQGAPDYICCIVKQPLCLFVYDNCWLCMCLIHLLFVCNLWPCK